MAVSVKAMCCGGVEMKLHRKLLAGCMNCTRMYLPFSGSFYPKRLFTSVFSSRVAATRTFMRCSARAEIYPLRNSVPLGDGKLGLYSYSGVGSRTLVVSRCQPRGSQSAAGRNETLLRKVSFIRHRVTDASVSSVPQAFVVMKFDQEGNVTTFEKKKTELCQELSLQARDLRFQHITSLTARNNCIIIRMEAALHAYSLSMMAHGRAGRSAPPGSGFPRRRVEEGAGRSQNRTIPPNIIL